MKVRRTTAGRRRIARAAPVSAQDEPQSSPTKRQPGIPALARSRSCRGTGSTSVDAALKANASSIRTERGGLTSSPSWPAVEAGRADRRVQGHDSPAPGDQSRSSAHGGHAAGKPVSPDRGFPSEPSLVPAARLQRPVSPSRHRNHDDSNGAREPGAPMQSRSRRRGAFENTEPGPYRILAVYSTQWPMQKSAAPRADAELCLRVPIIRMGSRHACN